MRWRSLLWSDDVLLAGVRRSFLFSLRFLIKRGLLVESIESIFFQEVS